MYLLHMQRWSLLALTFGAALLSYSAFAEQQANEPPVVWGLGVGVLAAEQPLKINSEWLLSKSVCFRYGHEVRVHRILRRPDRGIV